VLTVRNVIPFQKFVVIVLSQVKFGGMKNWSSDKETDGFSAMLQKMNCGHVLKL
jgi:hypothetical protein